MDISYLCVLVAAIMPYGYAGYSKFSGKAYDNGNPRDYASKIQGKAKRALGAELNSFEAFPAFAAAVIIGHLCGIGSTPLTVFPVLFIVFRAAYGYCYITDKPALRSTVWFCGFACVVALFVLSLKASSRAMAGIHF